MTEVPTLKGEECPVSYSQLEREDFTSLPIQISDRIEERLEFDKMGKSIEVSHQQSGVESGFDLTTFDTAENFCEVLEELDIDPYYDYFKLNTEPENDEYHLFVWANENGMIVCGNNPITGEYRNPNARPFAKGYASYIGIEGTDEFVDEAFLLIKENARYKDRDPRGRSFI